MKLEDLPSADLTEVFELPGTGVDFFQTNLVTMTGSYKSTTGTALRHAIDKNGELVSFTFWITHVQSRYAVARGDGVRRHDSNRVGGR